MILIGSIQRSFLQNLLERREKQYIRYYRVAPPSDPAASENKESSDVPPLETFLDVPIDFELAYPYFDLLNDMT